MNDSEILECYKSHIFDILDGHLIKGGRGFKSFNFENKILTYWVGRDGLDMYPQSEGGFRTMHAILPSKNWSNTEN